MGEQPARLGNPDNIKIMSAINMSCGCQRQFAGPLTVLAVGVVFPCEFHGPQVVISTETTIDGTARDAWEWIADRIGRPEAPRPDRDRDRITQSWVNNLLSGPPS